MHVPQPWGRLEIVQLNPGQPTVEELMLYVLDPHLALRSRACQHEKHRQQHQHEGDSQGCQRGEDLLKCIVQAFHQ